LRNRGSEGGEEGRGIKNIHTGFWDGGQEIHPDIADENSGDEDIGIAGDNGLRVGSPPEIKKVSGCKGEHDPESHGY
jgi:hypothetical protein